MRTTSHRDPVTIAQRSRANARGGLWIGLGLCVAWGCATPVPKLATRDHPAHVAALQIYHARCGTCHAPVEPQSRKREELVRALSRHRTRVKLTEEQWADLVDVLAAARPRP